VNEFARAVLGMAAVIAPLGALPVFMALAPGGESAEATLRRVVLSAGVALGVLVAAVFAAGPVIDFLNVSEENFQLAAGAAMAPLAFHLLLTGQSIGTPRAGEGGRLPAWLVPLGVPLLAGPAAIISAMSYGARFGEATAIGAIGFVLVDTAVLNMCGPAVAERTGMLFVRTLGRLSGGLLMVVAVELAVDGVRSV
jgi:multiple antibiotic resistance protein